MTFHDACRAVLAHCPDPYAKSYANAGLMLATDKACKVQALYILGNMTKWRGDVAREVRTTLKEISK